MLCQKRGELGRFLVFGKVVFSNELVGVKSMFSKYEMKRDRQMLQGPAAILIDYFGEVGAQITYTAVTKPGYGVIIAMLNRRDDLSQFSYARDRKLRQYGKLVSLEKRLQNDARVLQYSSDVLPISHPT